MLTFFVRHGLAVLMSLGLLFSWAASTAEEKQTTIFGIYGGMSQEELEQIPGATRFSGKPPIYKLPVPEEWSEAFDTMVVYANDRCGVTWLNGAGSALGEELPDPRARRLLESITETYGVFYNFERINRRDDGLVVARTFIWDLEPHQHKDILSISVYSGWIGRERHPYFELNMYFSSYSECLTKDAETPIEVHQRNHSPITRRAYRHVTKELMEEVQNRD